MAKTFYVSPGRSYTVTATEGTTITYPGVTKPAATVGSTGSVTFNCTGTEIVVSDNNAKIVQNFNNAGAAVAGAGGGSGSTEGVALLDGGNSFSGDQTIIGNVTINGALTVSGDATTEEEYNGATVIETMDTTITPEAGKYYKYTGTGDTITVAAPVWGGNMIISYLETTEPIDLQGVTWSPAKPSLTGAGPFVYTLVCAESGKVLASVMNYSVATAEAIQKVVPMKWSTYTDLPTIDDTYKHRCVVLGGSARALSDSVVIGFGSYAASVNATAVGRGASASVDAAALGINSYASLQGVAIGSGATTVNGRQYSTSIGIQTVTDSHSAITIGAQYTEATPDGNVTNYCKTQGTGSITIGAGANTLNNGDTESSNSVTIGCKAENKGADSVVIGASAKSSKAGVSLGAGAKSVGELHVAIGNATSCEGYYNSVAIGAGATTKQQYSVAVGSNAEATQGNATAIGEQSKGRGNKSIALGFNSQASALNAVAIGANASVSDLGATVIRSTAQNGTYTQLYFAGANTSLANTYENGEAMMGYVVRDSAGNIMTDAEGNAMVGTQKLSVLFPNNRGENAFTPAMLGLDDEWTPKPMFRPSDLDMPQEEPTEPEEYQPLPVYPIVEPEMPSELPSEES